MEINKRQRIYKTIMLLILSITITFIVTTIVAYKIAKQSQEIKYVTTVNSENLSTLGSTLERFRLILDKYYLGDINEQNLLEGAIKGYIGALKDPYTEYLTKEEMTSFTEEALGNYTGIGIYMTANLETNQILVLQPIKDTPAYKAGLLPGDVIAKVDGMSYTAEQLNEASAKIKGTTGTEVELEILRNEQAITLKIKREEIKLYHVESEVLSNDIGYIELITFDEGCSQEFKEKYEELKQQNIKSLIIDLRNNGGGLVNEAINIADLIVEKDKDLLITVDKNQKEKITKSEEDVIIDIPIVVLINQNSASASEILTGILKDYDKAAIVGIRTFGKGVIQQLIPLSDGSGIKITTNEYYTPTRNKIDKVGIEPDFVVHLPEDIENILDIEKSKDTQLQKAIEILK